MAAYLFERVARSLLVLLGAVVTSALVPATGDPTTWWAPTAAHREEHARYGEVRVRAWAGVHAKTEDHPARPPPRAGGSLDLAGRAGVHPAPVGPRRHRGSAPPPGAPRAADRPRPHARRRPPGVSAAPGRPRHARRPPKPCGRSRAARSDGDPARHRATRPSRRRPDSGIGPLPIIGPAESLRRAGIATG